MTERMLLLWLGLCRCVAPQAANSRLVQIILVLQPSGSMYEPLGKWAVTGDGTVPLVNHTGALQWSFKQVLLTGGRCTKPAPEWAPPLRGPTRKQKAGLWRGIFGPQKLIGRVSAFHPGHLSLLTPINPGSIMVTRKRCGSSVNQWHSSVNLVLFFPSFYSLPFTFVKISKTNWISD